MILKVKRQTAFIKMKSSSVISEDSYLSLSLIDSNFRERAINQFISCLP